METINAAETASICTPATLTHAWVIICCVSISFVLARLSIDLIQTASQKTRKHFRESHHATTEEKTVPSKEKANANYGSIQENGNGSGKETEKETAALLSSSPEAEPKSLTELMLPRFDSQIKNPISVLSLRFQSVLVVALLVVAMLKNESASCVLSRELVWTCISVVALGAILTYRDAERERFGYFSRTLYLASALTLAIPMTTYYFQNRKSTFSGDEIVVNTMGLYVLLALGECIFVSTPRTGISDEGSISTTEKGISTFHISTLLIPYVWPDKTSDSAVTNRIRAGMTWVCVIFSKACNLSAPILVSGFSALMSSSCCALRNVARVDETMYGQLSFHSRVLTFFACSSLCCFGMLARKSFDRIGTSAVYTMYLSCHWM
jgi:hypothetical protein